MTMTAEIHRNDLVKVATEDLEDRAAAAGVSNDGIVSDDSSRPDLQTTLQKLREELTLSQQTNPDALVSFPALLQRDSKRIFDILVVGLAGAGKSTLVNTLLLESVSKVSPGLCPDSTTDELKFEKKTVTIGDRECELHIWDCPGLDGFEGNDGEIIAKINANIKAPDLLILCVDIAANAGRQMKNAHDQIRKLKEVNDGKLFEHCAVALTKANVVSRLYEERYADDEEPTPGSPAWQEQLEKDIDKCKDGWTTVFRAANIKDEIIQKIPVCVFGEMKFNRDEDKKPVGITPIGSWGKTWMRENWSKLVNAGKDELVMLFFNVCNQFRMNEAVDPDLRLLAPDGSSLRLKDERRRYLAYLTLGVLGLGGVACAAAAPFTFGLSAVAALPIASSMFVTAGVIMAGSGKGITDIVVEGRQANAPRRSVVDTFAEVPVAEALARVAELERSLRVAC